MTEEEAFLRAIFDDPGDDTPRLAYADWLQERDDPRGLYLRAEAEWAKPWRDGVPLSLPPGEWRNAATGFDPVWLDRLTRPPLGVCCSHLGLGGDGVRLTEEDLTAVEEKMHDPLPLPPAYRAFLLNHNPALDSARLRGRHPETTRAMAFRFFPVDPAKVTGGGSNSREFGWFNRHNGDAPSLQIGLFGKVGNCLLMVGRDPASDEERLGQVWYYTLRPDRRWRVAESLPAFLATLRPE